MRLARMLERRRSEREAALQEARDYALRLQAHLGPLTAIVYGSYARGDFHAGSDVDVLVISEALPAHPLRRLEMLYTQVRGRLEPKGYTAEEFRARLEHGDPGAVEAMDRGIVVLARSQEENREEN
jgi:predicted nucleotidyltransferase